MRFYYEVLEFPRSCLWSNTVPTKAPSVYRFLDWSMDYSNQPVVVSHEHGSTEGSLLLRVNVEALRLRYHHSYWQTNHRNIIGLRGVNES